MLLASRTCRRKEMRKIAGGYISTISSLGYSALIAGELNVHVILRRIFVSLPIMTWLS